MAPKRLPLGFGSDFWGQTVKRLRPPSLLWLSAVMVPAISGTFAVPTLALLRHSGTLVVPTQLVRVPMKRQVTCPSGPPGQPRYSTLHTASQSQMQGNGRLQPLAAWNVGIPTVKAGSSLEVI